MTAENPQQPSPPGASAPRASDGDALHSGDPEIEALRDILLSRYRRQLGALERQLLDIERRTTDEQALIGMIAPIIGDVVRRKIRDARPEMIEAFYPIVGQIVVRAVAEAIRDLARRIDAQLRASVGLRGLLRRAGARARGVSAAQLALRDALPFEIAAIFLIHRETGLLIWHTSREPLDPADSELIGGMLTAIRDFAQDTLGRGPEGQLDEIQYGDRRILIEATRSISLAVVVGGVEPAGLRAEMRSRAIEIEHTYEQKLRRYDGDPAPLAAVAEPLGSLLAGARPEQLGPIHKLVLAGLAGGLLICVGLACLAGQVGWRLLYPPAPTPIVVVASPTAPPTPTATPAPAPTAPPTPTTTLSGVMTGDVFLRAGPSEESARLGTVVLAGQPIEVLAASRDWYRVRWRVSADSEVTGWAPGEWVDTGGPIPAWLVTPTAAP
ncbi:MAG: SH3 domain-containing protein [Kouleothrix sp.]|nr:SH3 domain-containing protein [Kouleothrix sp.]